MWCILTDISLKPDQCESLSWANDGEGPVGWTPMATSDAAGYAAAGDATMRRGQLHRRNWGGSNNHNWLCCLLLCKIHWYIYILYLSIYLSIYLSMSICTGTCVYIILLYTYMYVQEYHTLYVYMCIYIQYIYIIYYEHLYYNCILCTDLSIS